MPHKLSDAERELYVAHGYCTTGRDGERHPDERAFQDRVVRILCERTVRAPSERDALAYTQEELYAAVFPALLGAPAVPDAVRAALTRRIWGLTQATATGHVQRRLEGSAGVLCRASVRRGERFADGCYVTDDPELILADSLGQMTNQLVAHARGLATELESVLARHPQMRASVQEALDAALARIDATLLGERAPSGG